MQRAGQTPHGARPNREGARNFGFAHAPARRVKPPGRSLEPGSDAGPRGMAVPPERSGGQNSAYRFGCHKLLFSITYRAPRPVVTQLSRIGRKVGLRLPENRLAHETGKRADRTPLQAKRLERGTGTLESEPQWKERRNLAIA